jgi:hypothetical protein
MIDLAYFTSAPLEVDEEVTTAFEDSGLRVAPPVIRPDFGPEALPGLRWTTILNNRGGRGGGGVVPTPQDIHLGITLFVGAFLTAMGAAAGTDAYRALRRGVGKILRRVVHRITLRVVVVDGDSVTYEIPTDPEVADLALAAVQAHRETLSPAAGNRSFSWDPAGGEWIRTSEVNARTMDADAAG